MGCSLNKDLLTLYDPINSCFEKLGIQSLDKELINLECIMKNLEEIRNNYSLLFGRLIYNTGCIVLRKPQFSSALYGLCYQIARDVDPEIFNYIEINENLPYIQFINIDIKHDFLYQIKRNINDYLKFCEEINLLIKNISENIKDKYKFFKSNEKEIRKIEIQFTQKMSIKFKEIFKKINRAIDISMEIFFKSNDAKKDIFEFKEKFQNANQKNRFIKKLNSINKDARALDSISLYLKYTGSKNFYENLDDWKYLYSKKLRKYKLFFDRTSEIKIPLKNFISQSENEFKEIFGNQIKVGNSNKDEKEIKYEKEIGIKHEKEIDIIFDKGLIDDNEIKLKENVFKDEKNEIKIVNKNEEKI